MTTQKLGVILAGAADHRQYPDSEEDRRIEELGDEEFESYRTMARSRGYALENPGMFFIQHVYPSVVGNLPKIAQKARLAEEAIRSFLPVQSIEKWPQRAVTQIMSYLED
jgi:hypothetical protein